MSTRLGRFVAALVVVLAASTLGLGLTHTAAQTPSASYGVLARAAMPALGQYQGECRAWVQRVVLSALGIVIGTDYRLGYVQAGAVEVSAQAAAHGDIIQLANDADTGAAADYPGLHTAIILDNLGGGNFRVIDSNLNFDGVVRVHDYNPASRAARYRSITPRIWRMPGAAAPTAPVAPVAAPPAPHVAPTAGQAARVAADGDCLRVRSGPNASAPVIACLATDARVTVLQVGPTADGYTWDEVSTGSLRGWAADKYLTPAEAATTSEAAMQTPASPSPSPAPASAPAAAAPPPSTTGRILFGTIPQGGYGLVVFGGGTTDQLIAASGCAREATRFWASVGDQSVQLVPAASIESVNAGWNTQFAGGIPPSTPIFGSCEVGGGAQSAAASTPAPAPSAPAPASAAATPPTPAASSYTVAAGDTLTGIAERSRPANIEFLRYLEALKQLNGLDDRSTLSIGQKLTLPGADGGAAAPAGAAPAAVAPRSAPPAHTVVAGDTLLGVAARYCPDEVDLMEYLDALERLNGLDTSGVLSIGKVLSLPTGF